MATDCRIGAKADFIIYAGETWQAKWNIKDKNGDAIDLTGFTVGPLKIFKGTSDTVLVQITDGITTSGSTVTVNELIPATIKKRLGTGNYFTCPLMPPNGSPVAIINGKIQVDARK
jgi:hypothetical protein